MSNVSIDSNKYSVETAEQVYSSDPINSKGVKGAESTKIPEATTNLNDFKNDKVDIPKPNTMATPAQLNEDCGVMLDSLAKVIGELQKLMSKQREMNTQLLVSDLQQAKQENLNAAQEMRDDAKKAMVMQIVGAGISIATAAVSLGFSVKACHQQMNVTKTATEMAPEQTAKLLENKLTTMPTKDGIARVTVDEYKALCDKGVDIAKGIADSKAQLSSAIGRATETAGGAVKGLFDAGANAITTNSQARVKEHDAEVQELQSVIERLKEINETVKDIQRKSLETLSSVSQAEIDVLRKLSV